MKEVMFYLNIRFGTQNIPRIPLTLLFHKVDQLILEESVFIFIIFANSPS